MNNMMYTLHEQYDTHDKAPICECGRIKTYFTMSECDNISFKGLEMLLNSDEPASFKLIILGIMRYRCPAKVKRLIEKNPENILLKIVEKEKKENEDILSMGGISIKFTQLNPYSSQEKTRKWDISLELGYEQKEKIFEKLGYKPKYPFRYWVSDIYLTINKIKNMHSGIFGVFKYIKPSTTNPYRYIVVRPRIRRVAEFLKYTSSPSIHINKLRMGIVKGINWNGEHVD